VGPRAVGLPIHDDPVTDDQLDEPADVCVFDRLLAAGLSIERI
jgi:hypothetical protein